MSIRRVIALGALIWCVVMLIEGARYPSYAQGGASNPELPYNGLVSTKEVAFHVVNLEDEQGIAVQGSGPVGVHGSSPSGSGRYGAGVVGSGGGAFGIGVVGDGAAVGIIGVSRGLAGVSGRYLIEAEEDTGSFKKGETFALNQGVIGTATSGVIGIATSDGGRGVAGVFSDEPARNTTEALSAVGVNRGSLGTARHGVLGETDFEGSGGSAGVAGRARGGNESGVGVYGESNLGFAGFFRGKVTITDSLLVTKVNANELHAAKGLIGGMKLFKIDHPLEPANKFLSHGSVESSELKNLYDGVTTLDSHGRAEVLLPDWFEALNRDFRYQLTPIGGYAPLYIAQEIEEGRFAIAGGTPGLKVSWQVTGVRQDAYARAHPVVVEQAKSRAERGRYLHPRELGFSESLAIGRPDNRSVLSDQSHDVAPRRAANIRLAHSTSSGAKK